MTNFDTAISLDVLISASAGFLAVVGVYVSLKSKIAVIEATCENQAKELALFHEENKGMRNEISHLQKDVASGHNKLETSMAQMELRIIREFQSVVTQIVNQKDK